MINHRAKKVIKQTKRNYWQFYKKNLPNSIYLKHIGIIKFVAYTKIIRKLNLLEAFVRVYPERGKGKPGPTRIEEVLFDRKEIMNFLTLAG